jgi:hydrogenase/urease accessory protein HupE
MFGRSRYLVWAATFALLQLANSAAAHPLAPALLELSELDGGQYNVLWRVPALRVRGVKLRVRIPEHCREVTIPVTRHAKRGVENTWTVDCGAVGLVDRELAVDGLVSPLSAVVRVVFADGRKVDGLVTSGAAGFVVPADARAIDVARNYLRLGLEHIATGLDHLLFVFGLMLLASTGRRILATVTAFTVGHSVTLALAAFGLVHVGSAPVELAIALSVLLVAIEVARRDGRQSQPSGRPWAIAAGFGLLHGLGFAAALSNTGLTASALVLGLAAFNIGIEIGQLAFVLLVVTAGFLATRVLPPLPAWAMRVPVYAMGTVAAYWCFDRAAVWWGW